MPPHTILVPDGEMPHIDRVRRFFSAQSVDERLTLVDVPQLEGFAFIRSDLAVEIFRFVQFGKHSATGVLDSFPQLTEVVSFDIVSLFKDCVLWGPIDVFTEEPQFFHHGPPMDVPYLHVTCLGLSASDEDVEHFVPSGHQCPPTFPTGLACLVGLPRVFPIFPGLHVTRGVPSPEHKAHPTDQFEAWLYLMTIGLPVHEDFMDLPGFKSVALWSSNSVGHSPFTPNIQLSFSRHPQGDPTFVSVSSRLPKKPTAVPTSKRANHSLTLERTPQRKKVTVREPALIAPQDHSVLQETPSATGIPADIKFKDAFVNLTLLFCVIEVDPSSQVTDVHPPTFHPHFLHGLTETTKIDGLWKYF